MAKLVFLDTETTGLDPNRHEIIEIATIQWDGVNHRCWQRLIYPTHIGTADPIALKINKYNPDKWANAPEFGEIAHDLAKQLNGAIVVGHNVAFDMQFINKHFKKCGVDIPRVRCVDTITLVYEHLQPIGCNSLSMDGVRKYLGWTEQNTHTAMVDTMDCFRLYKLLCRASVWKRFTIWCGYVWRKTKTRLQ